MLKKLCGKIVLALSVVAITFCASNIVAMAEGADEDIQEYTFEFWDEEESIDEETRNELITGYIDGRYSWTYGRPVW